MPSVDHNMDRDLELALVERLRHGDPEAFDIVFEAYRARVYSFLVRLSRHRDVADDLLEETWLRLVSRASTLRPDTRLAPWLLTVARNLYWSHCRSRRLDEDARASIELWPAVPQEPSPYDTAAGHELEQRLERAIAGLPLRYREALLLVATEGLTPSEAADACGISPEALRQRLSRARAMVGRALASAETAAVPKTREVVR
jgi:RNA polymerase sigma-70 factor (ECF subfamily)